MRNIKKIPKGYTYLVMLSAIIVVSIVAGTASISAVHELKREREKELLFRGEQYYKAIRSFYLEGGRHRYPRFLNDLIQDPRFVAKSHIRTLYSDPLFVGEEKEWKIIRSPDGGIMGVVSSSTAEPLKKNKFPTYLSINTAVTSYSDWRFVYLGELDTNNFTPKRNLRPLK